MNQNENNRSLHEALKADLLPDVEAHWSTFPDTRIMVRKAQAMAVCELQEYLTVILAAPATIVSGDDILRLVNTAATRTAQLVSACYANPEELDKLYNEFKPHMVKLVKFDWLDVEGVDKQEEEGDGLRP